MNKELERYYEDRFSMMASKGWQQLIEDVETMRKNYADITVITSGDELQIRKGQIDILDWLISLKTISEAAFEDLQQDE